MPLPNIDLGNAPTGTAPSIEQATQIRAAISAASAAQGAKADSALQNAGAFATAAQGATADALNFPSAIVLQGVSTSTGEPSPLAYYSGTRPGSSGVGTNAYWSTTPANSTDGLVIQAALNTTGLKSWMIRVRSAWGGSTIFQCYANEKVALTAAMPDLMSSTWATPTTGTGTVVLAKSNFVSDKSVKAAGAMMRPATPTVGLLLKTDAFGNPVEVAAPANDTKILGSVAGVPAWIDPPSGSGGSSPFRGVYDGATYYAVDDVVVYNGDLYICTILTYGSNAPSDPTYWSRLGSQLAWYWQGPYDSMGAYGIGSVVSYNGMVYRRINVSDSGTPDMSTDWTTLFEQGAGGGGAYNSWRGEFDSGSDYLAGDFVFYTGIIYKCLSNVSGSTIIPTDTMYWIPVTTSGSGLNYVGPWDTMGMTNYVIGQFVSYQGALYKRIYMDGSGYTAPSSDTMFWELIVGGGGGGGSFLGEYDSMHSYSAGDWVVMTFGYTSLPYLCLQPALGYDPDVSPSFWAAAGGSSGGGGVAYKGTWDSATAYAEGDWVLYNVVLYRSSANSNYGFTPDPFGSAMWEVLTNVPSVAVVSGICYVAPDGNAPMLAGAIGKKDRPFASIADAITTRGSCEGMIVELLRYAITGTDSYYVNSSELSNVRVFASEHSIANGESSAKLIISAETSTQSQVFVSDNIDVDITVDTALALAINGGNTVRWSPPDDVPYGTHSLVVTGARGFILYDYGNSSTNSGATIEVILKKIEYAVVNLDPVLTNNSFGGIFIGAFHCQFGELTGAASGSASSTLQVHCCAVNSGYSSSSWTSENVTTNSSNSIY